MMRLGIVAVKVVLAFALVYVIVNFVGKANIIGAVSGANRVDCLCAFAFLVLAVAINALRWRVAMTALHAPINVRIALLGTFEAVFFQQILPSGVGGDISRSVRAFDGGAAFGKSVIGVLIDRANGLLFVAFTLIAARFFSVSAILGTRIFSILFSVSLIVVAGALAAIALGLVKIDGLFRQRVRAVKALIDDYSRCMRSPLYLARILVLLTFSNLAYIDSFRYCASALGRELSWWDGAIVVQGMSLAAIIPLSIGGWGLREGAALLLFAPLGVEGAPAVSISILFGLLMTSVGVIGAIIWLSQSYRRLEKFTFGRRSSPPSGLVADEADA